MQDYILYILLKIPCMKKRYPKGLKDPLKMEDASFHVNFYLTLGLLINILALHFSPWINMGLVALFIHIFVKELILDGHLKRIWNKTESPKVLLDLKADLITRLAGLVIPAVIAIF